MKRTLVLLCGVALLGAACAKTTMVLTPAVERPTVGDFQLGGKLEYEGNRDYIPRTIADAPSASLLTLRFGYAVKTESDRTSIYGAVFIPPVVMAIPGVLGGDELGVVAVLEVLRGGSVLKTYSATAVVKKKPTIFHEGETFTEMRRRGLLAVRDAIESQMLHDREALERLAAD